MIAECLRILIGKKYITFENLNRLVQSFPYKGGDQTNRPQKLPHNFLSKKTVGGNAHENWCLLRLLPLIIGQHIPENEPAWELLLDLKNIVELVVCPVHNSDSVAYLESKILDHHQRYKEVCPDRRPIAKTSLSGSLSLNNSPFWSTCLIMDNQIRGKAHIF